MPPDFIINRLIDRMTGRPKRFFTAVVAIGLSLNLLLSAAAVGRWTSRQQGIEAQNRVELALDEQYPDDMMEEIYPNMVPVKGE